MEGEMRPDAEAAPVESPGEPVDPTARLIRDGSHREAAGRCAREHGAVLGRLCMALLGRQADAEEALQETLLQAYRAMPTYRADGPVRAWLFGIARRVCARRLEARASSARRLELVRDTDGPAALPDALVEAAARAATIREALERLTPTEREAVLLRYEADLSFREVGHACGIDAATARKRCSRGLDRLRTILAPEDAP
ncbi:MAG: sigma-70 family RNA polymerase sigma factor [Deltaproteobacteria bacterium]|nr:sigma-70 family RNA polymerase sigma factor [Deltaproteobacteria bacterium]